MLCKAYGLLKDGKKAPTVINQGIYFAQQNTKAEITPQESAW